MQLPTLPSLRRFQATRCRHGTRDDLARARLLSAATDDVLSTSQRRFSQGAVLVAAGLSAGLLLTLLLLLEFLPFARHSLQGYRGAKEFVDWGVFGALRKY